MSTDPISESAKATQEVAKTAGKAIDAGRGLGGWLDKIFGPGIEHTVARYWSDRQLTKRIEAVIYDWERLELLLLKAQRRLEKKGVTRTRIPPPKIMLPILEHATMEYEDDLHTRWANLTASAVDPSLEEIETKYISVLAEMSNTDCRVLESMYAEWFYWEDRSREKHTGKKDESRYSSGVSGFPGNDETSVILLYRLGIILPVSVEFQEYHPGGYSSRNGEEYSASTEDKIAAGDLSVVAITEFGERFCKAVIGDVRGVYKPPDWVEKTAALK